MLKYLFGMAGFVLFFNLAYWFLCKLVSFVLVCLGLGSIGWVVRQLLK